jgi:hypothetical protein
MSVAKQQVCHRNYTQNNNILKKIEVLNHLLQMFTVHIQDSFFPNFSEERDLAKLIEMRDSILFETKKYTYDKKEVVEIKNDLQKSICRTTHQIMERTIGSKKGIMHADEYFHEVLGKGDFWTFIHQAKGLISNINPNFIGNTKCFVVTPGVEPSVALDSFIEGPTVGDCGLAIEAIYGAAVRDAIGKEKFNAYFSHPDRPLYIRPMVCPDSLSSLWTFTEHVDPRLFDEASPDKLEVGDHIGIRGVPWYAFKHPQGNLPNAHVVVLGHNEKNECLVGGLDTSCKKTIPGMYQDLVLAFNRQQTPENEMMYAVEKKYSDRRHVRINDKLKDAEHIAIAQDETKLFKNYTVEEVRKLGGCYFVNKNSNRISPFIIASLKAQKSTENLFHVASLGKAFSLAWDIHAVNAA